MESVQYLNCEVLRSLLSNVLGLVGSKGQPPPLDASVNDGELGLVSGTRPLKAGKLTLPSSASAIVGIEGGIGVVDHGGNCGRRWV